MSLVNAVHCGHAAAKAISTIINQLVNCRHMHIHEHSTSLQTEQAALQ